MTIMKNPCDHCRQRGTCKAERICGKWEDWFRHYWRALRKKYLT